MPPIDPLPSDQSAGVSIDRVAQIMESVFGGITKAVQQSFGSDYLKQAAAAVKLGALADLCDKAAEELSTGGSVAGCRGEMAFHLETLEAALEKSSFAAALFRAKIEAALDALNQGQTDTLREIAGYFRASAATVPASMEITAK